MEFRSIIFLFICPVFLAILGWFLLHKNKTSLFFSNVRLFAKVKNTGKSQLFWLPNALRFLTLICIAIALAGPQSVLEETHVSTEGIDIVLVLDASTSMAAEDFIIDEKRQNRLFVVKNVIEEFIHERAHDRIALIAFAAQAHTVSPLTTDHPWLNKNLERINFGLIQDGTAIGSAITSAVSRLEDSDAKSRVIILLTDGVNNAGKIDPVTAAKAAKALGITIYAIGAGTKGLAPYPVTDLFGRKRYAQQKVNIDEDTLKEMADLTGGQYFRATDTESLRNIYQEIDELEKTEIKEQGFRTYEELFWYFALAALILIFLEMLLRHVVLLKDSLSKEVVMKFANPLWLNILFVLIPFGLMFIWFYHHRKWQLAKFMDIKLWERNKYVFSRWLFILKACLLSLSLMLLILALARPQWGFEWREVKRQGIDIVIAVDTSKSMLAQDVKPNRLERVKLAIKDLLKEVKGDRLGLMAFAGEAFFLCPLTVDYQGFVLSLNDLNVNIIPRGGTNIAEAIDKALKNFEEETAKHQAIVIVTDGESLEGDVVDQAQKAKDQGVRIYTVGIGTKQGELIQISSNQGQQFLKDQQGNVVKSRLNEDLLKRIALTTGGSYVHASGAQFGLDLIYQQELSRLEKRDIEEGVEKHYFERFQFPLFLVFCFLCLDMFIDPRRFKEGQ